MANGVVLYDRETARRYVDDAGYSQDRVFTAQNALDQAPIVGATRVWSQDPSRLPQFQRAEGILERPVILHVSRILPSRHLDVLVRAMAPVLQEYPDALAVLIGDGEPEKTRLRELSIELGVEESVRFLNAMYDEERLAPWFMSSLAFCSPGHLGLAIFHAFGYGLPVIAGNAIRQHPPEARALVDGHNGLLFEHDNPAELASALSRLIDNPQFAARMGSNSLKDVTHTYTIDNMVDGLEAAIRGNSST